MIHGSSRRHVDHAAVTAVAFHPRNSIFVPGHFRYLSIHDTNAQPMTAPPTMPNTTTNASTDDS